MTESGSFKLKFLEEQYENLTFLGRSEEKGVFLCKDRETGRIVVKKYVSLRTRPVYEQLGKIFDPHITRVYETAFDREKGIIIEEFINGVTLREYIRIYGLPSQETLCRIVCDLCDALTAPHDLGIIHRDIKPENIILSNDGVLKLIDFGIARTLKEAAPQDTSLLGTPGYAPPEQFGFAQTNASADIYAIGVLISELLLGTLLPADQFRKQGAALGTWKPIILKCTEIDPNQRYQTTAELQSAVQKMILSRQVYTLPAPSSKAAALPKLQNSPSGSRTISWLPGFRTGVAWKNVVATIGYLFLILFTCIMITAENYAASAETFILELLAIFLYSWAPILIAFNICNWDRKIFPFSRLPLSTMIVIRIFLFFFLFYMGVLLENYVDYTLMGLAKSS